MAGPFSFPIPVDPTMTLIARPTLAPPCPAPVRMGTQALDFSSTRHIMGVLNVTPDSFSDGGLYDEHTRAIARALEMIEQGAHIIDVGGESTRPGSDPVGVEEELRRVVPVIEGIKARAPNALISIDTTKALVASHACAAGAGMINDISGLMFDPDMAHVAARTGAALVVMHIKDIPKTMQDDPTYDDVVEHVRASLAHSIERATHAGVDPTQIIVDPGIGFGKTVAHNYELMRHIGVFADMGHAVLLGVSRKSVLGATLADGRPASERVWATAAAVSCGIWSGAHMVRVHDIEQMADVVKVAQAFCGVGDV